jgi:O-antigen ligase
LVGLASCLDSVAPVESWQSLAAHVRYVGLIVAAHQLSAQERGALAKTAGVILLIWIIDGFAQAAIGTGLRGVSNADRLSGIFGADNLKLGPTLGVLCPIFLCLPEAFGLSGRRLLLAQVLAWSACAALLLLAGSRASWVCFFLISVIFLWRIAKARWRPFALYCGAGLLLCMLAGTSLIRLDARFAARWQRTVALAHIGTIDFALAGRLPIFETAHCIIRAHPINGVGLRAFRYAYPSCAGKDDPWVNRASASSTKVGAAHPHHWLLELTCDTGLLGLFAWCALLFTLARRYQRAASVQREQARPYALALLLMLFPFNTHLALYSAFWGSVFWWLFALCHANLRDTAAHE